jgi:hypothetical protein
MVTVLPCEGRGTAKGPCAPLLLLLLPSSSFHSTTVPGGKKSGIPGCKMCASLLLLLLLLLLLAVLAATVHPASPCNALTAAANGALQCIKLPTLLPGKAGTEKNT